MATAALILQRYATALHELARQAGAVARVQADLLALGERLAGDPGLSRQLESPRLTRDRKRELLLASLGTGRHDLVRRSVLLLVDKGRAGLVREFPAVFAAVARRAADEEIARVQSAAPLDEATRGRLREQLGRLTGKSITLREEVSAELIGGLRIVLGSRMIDGSVRRRLDQMQERLLAAPLAGAG